MTTARIDGTQGYDQDVESFFARADGIAFAEKFADVLHLMPAAPARILDIGAGSGKDAFDFAALGHAVLAVEPTPVLLAGAIARHGHPAIAWLDDGLPDLAATRARDETFDLILLSAVWMHLDAGQRRRAMPNVAALMAEGGRLILSLRHGPVPPGRRMFEVSADETIGLARAEGLSVRLREERGSIQAANRLAGVTWTILAFEKAKSSTV
jgi:SAM-dependent methyltransferase